MPKYLSVVLAAALFTTASCGIAPAKRLQKIKNVPIQPTSAVSGQGGCIPRNCAVCHGALTEEAARPAASALKLPRTI